MARTKPAYHHGDLRNALVTGALKLMEKSGGYEFSLRDLAGQLGVSYAALYSHFEDKDALLAALAAGGFNKMSGMIEAARRAAHGEAEEFMAAGLAYIQFGMENPALYKLMFNCEELRHKREQYPEMMNAAMGAFNSLIGMLAHMQETGFLRKAPLAADGLTVVSHVHGMVSMIVSGRIEGAAQCAGLPLDAPEANPQLMSRYSLKVLMEGMRAKPA